MGELPASDRSIRRYVRTLKEEVASAQMRYYEPILEDVPGVQCQVGPGELRGVLIGGEERPLDTQTFIQLHDEALRYFGGLPEECWNVVGRIRARPTTACKFPRARFRWGWI